MSDIFLGRELSAAVPHVEPFKKFAETLATRKVNVDLVILRNTGVKMNKLLNMNFGAAQVSAVLLILRIGVAGMMLVHGFPKLEMLISGGGGQFPGVMGMSAELSLALAVFAEVLCSLLLLFGFGTRLATIPLIITMLVAVFYVHAADPFSNRELGLHYLLVYVALFILGAGRYSVDAILIRQSKVHLERA